jgi:hypothetical protein
LGDQKQKLLDAFVSKTHRPGYLRPAAGKLEEEITLAKMQFKDAQLDEVDVEAVLTFADTFLLNTARIWTEMSSEQRQRFQRVLFPEGIEFESGGVFRTAVTCPFFRLLQPEMTPHTQMAAPTGFEPVYPD